MKWWPFRPRRTPDPEPDTEVLPYPLVENINAVRGSDGTLYRLGGDVPGFGYTRPQLPPGWNLGTTETRLPAPSADTVEIPTVRKEIPVSEEPVPLPAEDLVEGDVQPDVRPRDVCPNCRGRGVIPTLNDLLRESLGALDGQGDVLVRTFYSRVAARAPHLVPLFPPDLLTAATGDPGSAGAQQRDKLLHALIDLSNYYDPGDPEGMAYLDTVLAAHGRRHARFRRPDGSERGATFDEYGLVKVLLFESMHDIAGELWRPEYDAAWSEAYDHAAVEMLYAAQHWQTRAARLPRRPGDE